MTARPSSCVLVIASLATLGLSAHSCALQDMLDGTAQGKAVISLE